MTWKGWTRRGTGGISLKGIHVAVHDVSPIHWKVLGDMKAAP